MDDYEAVYDANAVEEVEGNADDDNHPSSEHVTAILTLKWIHNMDPEVGNTT